MHNKSVHMVAFILLVIGGLNWGLVGLLNFNLVDWLFIDLLGVGSLAAIVYILVGLSAVYELVMHKHTCKMCTAGGSSTAAPDAGGVTHG